MRFENIRSIKPLNKLMIQLLQDCHKRKTSDAEHLDHYDQATINGLKERGLILINKIVKDQKDQFQCSLTNLGKEYLDHYFPDL